MTNRPTHLNEAGDAHVVSISAKPVTSRFAVAECFVRMESETLRSITEGVAKKGDVIAVARIAGIQATKRTAELIPLCHPIAVTGCDVDITTEDQGVRVRARVDAVDRTGAEMEAMMAASVAGLTLYDMVKGTERGVTIETVRLLEKAGGKSGHWKR